MKKYLVLATILSMMVSFTVRAAELSEKSILEAQKKWAEGIVQIGKVKTSGGDYKAEAKKLIDSLYAYDSGKVLFKPTKAKEEQFRESYEKAHSYFVKGVVGEDKGFAINPWKKVRFDNRDIMILDDVALVMGNYFFTSMDDQEVKVEYTFGYRLDDKGNVKIVLHHSSLPYNS